MLQAAYGFATMICRSLVAPRSRVAMLCAVSLSSCLITHIWPSQPVLSRQVGGGNKQGHLRAPTLGSSVALTTSVKPDAVLESFGAYLACGPSRALPSMMQEGCLQNQLNLLQDLFCSIDRCPTRRQRDADVGVINSTEQSKALGLYRPQRVTDDTLRLMDMV